MDAFEVGNSRNTLHQHRKRRCSYSPFPTCNSSGNWNYTLSSTTNLAPGLYSVRVDWKGNEYTFENIKAFQNIQTKE